jgi:hypothetical protein
LNDVIAGLITLAFVGMLQSLGALADTVSVDPTWRSDASSDDERGHPAGRGPSSPDAIGLAAASIQGRAQPTLDPIADTAALLSSVRLPSPESRAPPALLSQVSL